MYSVLKLINGETIIAEVVHQDTSTTSVLEPLALDVGESDTGRPMLLAMTWIPLTKKVNLINIKTDHVVAVSECDENMTEYYKNSLDVLKGVEISDPEEEFGEPEPEILSANTVH